MQYRKFGRTGFQVSALGFGCMRLPVLQGPGDIIDESEAVRMIRHSIESGVNYIDTAYSYHNGNSEIVTGKALCDGYRQKVKLATKSPVWFINKPEDFDRYLDEQLGKLLTDHIDYYLLHGLNKPRWKDILDLGIIRKAEEALKSGKIGHIGFSFHDEYNSFKEIIDRYDKWDFCQIQYNYLDIGNQAGMKGLKYAASKGLAVVVMEPLLGGRLANPPDDILRVLRDSGSLKSPVELAMKWIWDQPEVTVILSGMTTMEQVKQNLDLAGSSDSTLSLIDNEAINKLREKYKERFPIPCTRCNYCMPCPNGINIPWNFELFNDGMGHNDLPRASIMYKQFMGEHERAGTCIECGECSEKCPQNIDIGSWMTRIHAALG